MKKSCFKGISVEKMKKETKVPTTTTTTRIFKLVGPCEILSHGQKGHGSKPSNHVL